MVWRNLAAQVLSFSGLQRKKTLQSTEVANKQTDGGTASLANPALYEVKCFSIFAAQKQAEAVSLFQIQCSV